MRFCKLSFPRKTIFVLAFLFFSTDLFADNLFREGVPTISAASDVKSSAYPHFSSLVRELSPSVVNISGESGTEAGSEEQGKERPQRKKEFDIPLHSLGSGFVIHEDGYIVTNNHVIDKSESIIVRFLDDKTEYKAEVVGKDDKTDLALLRVNTKKKLKPVYVGDSDKLEVGEWVIAIGNQFQLGQTVTAGIVSAKARRLPTKVTGPYDSFIQTDASINPGSSGGPLFNTKGQVVGITTAIYSPGQAQFGGTGFNIGIGFAVPINLAKDIVLQIKASGHVTRGLLGVIIQQVDSDVANALGLEEPIGALVSDVVADSPAAKAQFEVGDVIVKYDGTVIKEHEDLPLLVANTAIGSSVEAEIIRDGKRILLKPAISELKDEDKEKRERAPTANRFGFSVSDIKDDIARVLDLSLAKGVLVTFIEPGSAAERAGLQRGDIIEKIGKELVIDSATLEKVLDSQPKKKSFLMLVRRKEGTRFLTFKAG